MVVFLWRALSNTAVSNGIFQAERIASRRIYGLFKDQHKGQCGGSKWVEEVILFVCPCEVFNFDSNQNGELQQGIDQRSKKI